MIRNFIEESWRGQLSFLLPQLERVMTFVEEEYATGQCFPPREQIFEAFQQVPFNKVRVVILGQDPYHDIGQAHGLSFSVPDGVKLPPSLRNIFKEIAQETGAPMPVSGNLLRWAKQGVFLLNSSLTVRAHQPLSHSRCGWEAFTDGVIARLSSGREGLVFMLWGAYAIHKASLIDSRRHLVLTSPHPSPLSARRGFFGNNHFNLCNQYLSQNGQQLIQW